MSARSQRELDQALDEVLDVARSLTEYMWTQRRAFGDGDFGKLQTGVCMFVGAYARSIASDGKGEGNPNELTREGARLIQARAASNDTRIVIVEQWVD